MKPIHALPLAAVISLALLGACNKPADTAAADAAAAKASTVADSAADAAAAAPGAGGAVSAPQPNGAVNVDANATSTNLAPASNSFTEGQAKGHFENAGYSHVTGLTKTPDGMWTAKAMKGGKSMDVTLDFKGAITAK
ncbi:hypothetical protein [Phenylobacterium sp.]|uniref:hypothetical protein n=1 Tax=Phenylobacterium sp. TaxID=1871053 RepID=UPI00286A3EFB|nr:hypothetical protein [Phenylobacterium sp.]